MTGLPELAKVNWDFHDAPRDNGSHSFHPYPAKFISHIPAKLIAELSSPGELVLDPFCGSGTALVEAMNLGRNAIGADINPVAVLVARAKTLKVLRVDSHDVEALLDTIADDQAYLDGKPRLGLTSPTPMVPRDDSMGFWFDDRVVQELGVINAEIANCSNWRVALLAKVALSSIIVGVSKQDSDTRYVRREKHLKEGVVFQRFRSKLREMVATLLAHPSAPSISGQTWLGDARTLPLGPGCVDLVVTSPPYPNAYSYHLYHRTRLVWLGFDPLTVKNREIGNHRAYSARNGAGRSTFKSDMVACFQGLATVLRPGRFACFVIGDSIVRGELIDNSLVLSEAAAESGFQLVERYERNLDLRKKSFNPVIGKIKQEHILVFAAP